MRIAILPAVLALLLASACSSGVSSLPQPQANPSAGNAVVVPPGPRAPLGR